MQDHIVRAITKDGFLKATAICSTGIAERARQIHHTTPTATAALGRVLTAASMMGNMQKVEDGSMTLQVRGGGPIGTITVVSDSVGNVRGCVTEPRVPLVEKYPGKLDVGATVGTDGTLTVIRDLQMKEPYIGSTQLVSGEIGDDVTAYFAQSEQTPTACALGVLVDRDQSVKVAGGYLLQLLPGAPDEVIDALEKGWAWGWKKRGWVKSDKKPALNSDLWEILLTLTQKHDVHYHWVKGHAENPKNNRCDELAVSEWKKRK